MVITTVFFGSFMPLVQRWLVPPTNDDAHEYDKKEKKKSSDNEQSDLFVEGGDQLTTRIIEHEEFRHPNLDVSNDENNKTLTKSGFQRLKKKYSKNTCGNYFRRFDKFIMRPIFIYHYNEGATKRKDEFIELFMNNGDKLE